MQDEFLGYKVTPGTTGHIAYTLTGPKGATIKLLRLVNQPTILFAVNAKTLKVVSVKGYTSFSDASGKLVAGRC